MDECRALSLAAVLDRAIERRIRLDRVRAVALLDKQIRETGDKLRYIAAGSADLDGDADRVAVVLDAKDDGQLEVAGGVECLPPLALARGAVANGHVDDLVAFETNDLVLQLPDERSSITCLGRTDRMQRLRSGARRLRRHIQRLVAPM